MRFSFVLLNYNNYTDTDECISSLLNNIDYDNYYIIIVDNSSYDKSNILLGNKYKNNSKIIIINNKKNLGFSKGNNIGFRYAKYKLNSDFICYLNNDTIIKQKKFIDIIIQKYSKYNFAVLGPDIISLKNNKHTNPQSDNGKDNKKYIKYLLEMRIYLILNYFNLDNFSRKLLQKIKFKILKRKEINYITERFNVQLHGACLIFSPIFINKYDGLLEKTFMYMEEDILYTMCKKNRLKMMYTPDLIIYHKEGSTLEKLKKKGILNRRFYYKNNIISTKIAKKYFNIIES